MTFNYEDADLSKTIGKIITDDSSCEIKYLDGNSEFRNVDEEDLKKIKKDMLEQAIERQKKIDIDKLKLTKNIYLVGSALCAVALQAFRGNSELIPAFLILCFLIIGIYKFNLNNKYLREMKKYKLFLEFVDDLDIVNQSSSLKLVCFDNIYQIPVDIDTIDEYFSYSDIKILNKQYKRLKSKNEKDK